MPSSATWQPLEVFGCVLTAVAELVPADQLESAHWYHHPGDRSELEITLSDGEIVGCYVPADGSGLEQGIGYAVCWVFRSLQRVLSTTRQLWGQPIPHCPGHRHQLLIRQRDGLIQLYCPTTDEVVRTVTKVPAPVTGRSSVAGVVPADRGQCLVDRGQSFGGLGVADGAGWHHV